MNLVTAKVSHSRGDFRGDLRSDLRETFLVPVFHAVNP